MRNSILVLLLAILVAGCESIKDALPNANPQAQVRVTSCDGLDLSWDYCYEVAARNCPGGYQVSDRREASDSPSIAYRSQVTRSMTYKCK